MGAEIRWTPPSVGDVLIAAAALDWPAIQTEELSIEPGEASWRAAVTEATTAVVWEALREADVDAEPEA